MSALPGGIGSFEVVMVLLLSRLALPVVLFRFCTLWLTSLLGFLFLLGLLSFVSRGNANSPRQSVT